jgi:hypothetical protein
VRHTGSFEEQMLPGFPGVCKAGIIIGEIQGTILAHHFIEVLPTRLGQNDRCGCRNHPAFIRTRRTPGTDNLSIRRKKGMKR